MNAGFLQRLLAGLGSTSVTTGRTTGPPTSSNGASSMHLFWEVPPQPLVEVSADLEILTPPKVSELYFWALQVNFVAGGAGRGGAHIGLQHHPAYPDNGAINWGGYKAGGGELDGSLSELPSALDNINTRTFPWTAGRRYRLRVFPVRPGHWRGTVLDTITGTETVIRDLYVDADHLVRPMVWSEVFAHCDHPSVTIRWSNLQATTAQGAVVRALTVRCNYQDHADGGCANTNSTVDRSGIGFVQQTNTTRAAKGGLLLTLPDIQEDSAQ